MPDPSPRELLELLAGSDADGDSAEEVRRRYEEDAIRVFGAAPPVQEVRDIVVSGPHGDVPCRRYEPGAELAGGLVLYCHGGGFTMGSVASHDGLCRALAVRSGAAVLSVDYRLTPEHRFPVALDDATAALASVIEERPVVVAGDSAGGNLAAALALRARERGWTPAGQLLLYPMLDARCDTPAIRETDPTIPPNREVTLAYWREYLGSDDVTGAPPEASPSLAADLHGLARALVVTAACDPLRDDGAQYAGRLREAGVEARHLEFAGMVHGFMRVPSLAAWHAAMDECAGFVRERLAAAAPL